jgi:tagatose 6-phosphate kinase
VILTVTLNLALDITYHVDTFERGHTTRVGQVSRRAGGKGVNVGRVLHKLGHEVAVTGLAGGHTGEAARAELKSAGLRDQVVEIEGQSRLTIVVVDREGEATGFSEPGPEVTASEWQAARKHIEEMIRSASAVVLSGSLPPGVPSNAYEQLTYAAHAAGVPTLLDAEGEALALGVRAQPTLVKINRLELRGVTGQHEIAAGAQALRGDGAQIVVVTDGPAGLSCFTDDAVIRAAPREVMTGNPTGAGDAASAALAGGLIRDAPWPERLADAAALSAAAVSAPEAGSFDQRVYERLREITARTGPTS